MTEKEAIDVLNMIEAHGPLPINAKKMAINALEDVQQYRALEKHLSDMFGGSLSLKMCVDELERILTEPDSPHPMNAKSSHICKYCPNCGQKLDWGNKE